MSTKVGSRALIPVALFWMMAHSPLASAQKPGTQTQQPGQSAPGSQQGGGGASLQGLSWPRSTWDSDLGLPATIGGDETVLVCYTLMYGNSATQPLILKPANTYDERGPFAQTCKADDRGNLLDKGPVKKRCEVAQQQKISELEWAVHKMELQDAEKKLPAPSADTSNAKSAAEDAKRNGFKDIKWSYCSKLDAEHPIRMGQTLVIGIDTNHAAGERVKILNLNLTNQQGNPINPTPVRQSFGSSGSTPTNLEAGHGPYYLTWPNQIPGDAVPTVNVNAVYTPPIPGDKWLPGTFYPAGSIVTNSNADGHYYVATSGGVSSANQL